MQIREHLLIGNLERRKKSLGRALLEHVKMVVVLISLLDPLKVKGLTLKNRIAMPPMDRVWPPQKEL